MPHRNYFDDKIQNVVEVAVDAVVEDWKLRNPHEPDLQAALELYAVEFLAHVRSHRPAGPRLAFAAGGWVGDSEQLRAEIRVARQPSVWTATRYSEARLKNPA